MVWNKGKKLHYSVWNKGKHNVYSKETLESISRSLQKKRPKYQAIHAWLRKYFGHANICEVKKCKNKNAKYEWAKIHRKQYIRKRENYVMLCQSHHYWYDKSIHRILQLKQSVI